MWEAWMAEKGTNRTQARDNFVNQGLAIMERNKIEWRFQEYFDKQKEYKECMAEKIANAPKEEAERLKKE